MEIHQITDFNAPELDVYARLTENQLVNRADPENALFVDRKSTRLNSSHVSESRMPSSA